MLKAEFAVADAYFLFVVSSLPMKRLWTVQRDLVVAVHGGTPILESTGNRTVSLLYLQ